VLLQEAGDQFPEQEQDKAGMGQLDADLSPGKLEAIEMGGREIDQQHAADEIAAREDGDHQVGTGNPPHDEEAAKVFLLHRPDAEVHLVERRDEDQDERQDQQPDGELERDEEIAELAKKRGHDPGVFTVCRNSMNVAFWPATMASGPISLKNQLLP